MFKKIIKAIFPWKQRKVLKQGIINLRSKRQEDTAMEKLTYKGPGRAWNFTFFEQGPGGDAGMVVQMTPNYDFGIQDVRITLGTSHPSEVQCTCRLSSVLGSEHNITFFSQAMFGLSGFLWQPSCPLYLLSGDTVIFSMPMGDAITWGVVADGWAICEQ
jgi:hypothetical protein